MQFAPLESKQIESWAISPATDPDPYGWDSLLPVPLKELLPAGLYYVLSLGHTLHLSVKTYKIADPVSKVTVIFYGGVPNHISPVYY